MNALARWRVAGAATILILATTAPARAQASAPAAPLAPPAGVSAALPKNDDGTHVALTWKASPSTGVTAYLVLRAPGAVKTPPVHTGAGWAPPWKVAARVFDTAHIDEVGEREQVSYAVVAVREVTRKGVRAIVAMSPPALAGAITPTPSWLNTSRWFYMLVILLMGLALAYYTRRAKRRGHEMYIRRIPGVDAIEEAVGRSTEMGRPVLYVTGVEEITNIQTIASLLILGRVAEMTAEYDTDLKVMNCFPLTMVVAEEIVKQGYANAGRVDAHKPENTMFISSEQFAFAIGVNGLMLRDRPATNIYLGRFFAESLMLAETGYVTRAIQIAGTAEISQLPFFIAACDYTIMGEELYAVSAYLSRDPSLLATLKSTDLLKLLVLALVVVGAALSTLHIFELGPAIIP